MRCPALSVAGKKQYLGHDGSHRSSKKRTQKLKECIKLGFQLFLLVNVELKQLIPAKDKLKLHHRHGTMGSYLACQSTFHQIKKKNTPFLAQGDYAGKPRLLHRVGNSVLKIPMPTKGRVVPVSIHFLRDGTKTATFPETVRLWPAGIAPDPREKKTSYFPLCWLFNRDPGILAYYNPKNKRVVYTVIPAIIIT